MSEGTYEPTHSWRFTTWTAGPRQHGGAVSAVVDGPVVVGIDGSPDARRALRLAGEIARGLRTQLVVVHAVDPTTPIGERQVGSDGHHAETAAAFGSWCEALEEIGIDEWEPELRHGEPAEMILRVAHDVRAALVVIGRHGAGRRPELVLGSTAHQVAERSPCPTLIIPPVGRSWRPDG